MSKEVEKSKLPPEIYQPLKRNFKWNTSGLPDICEPVLAQIGHQNSLGLSKWHEVVRHDGQTWQSFDQSCTFMDGEQVLRWTYIENQ